MALSSHICCTPVLHRFTVLLRIVLLGLLAASCSSGGEDPSPPKSTNASLESLSIDGVVLDTAFSSSVTDYTASVPNDTDNIDVSVTASDDDASVTINGGVDTNIPLSVGDNTIVVVVTAEDGTTARTYTIVVSRAALSGNANLQDLRLSVGESIPIDLYPSFDPQVSEYQAVLVSRQSVTVDAIAEDDRATVSWEVAPECDMQLCLGLSQLAVTVIAEDGITDQTYSVSLMNQASRWYPSPSVSLSADGATMAIGLPNHDSTSTGVNGDETQNEVFGWLSGAVYVFARDGTGIWAKQALIKATNPDYDDQFGASVALSGDGSTLVVAAPGDSSAATGVGGDEPDNSESGSGAAYVFARDSNGVWSQDAYLKSSNTGDFDGFGHSVALSANGTTLAVSGVTTLTYLDFDFNYPISHRAGTISVFTRDDIGGWHPIQSFTRSGLEGFPAERIPDSPTDIDFGSAISLSGDGSTLAVGAPWCCDAQAEIIEKIGSHFAQSEGSNYNDWWNAGSVFLFARDDAGTWSEQAVIGASNASTEDLFGDSVALSGDGSTLVVGAPGEDSAAIGVGGDESDNSEFDSGAAYVFARDGDGSWTQQTYIKASNTDSSDRFGRDIEMSPDGLTLAVLASNEDSPGNEESGDGINDYANDTTGAIYLFRRGDSGLWSQRHYAKPLRHTRPYSVEGGDDLRIYMRFGPLGLSADGHTCIVGTQSNDSSAPELIWNNEDNTHLGAGVVFGYTFQN